MADVRYIITVDESGATKKIQTFDKAIGDLGKTSANTSASGVSFGKSLTGQLIPAIGAAALAVGVVTGAVRTMVAQFSAAIKEASAAERVDRALESALDITGRSATMTASSFMKLASAIQRETIYGDEAIKSAQTLLIQLTTLDKNGIERATKASIGLASVLGMDLNSAAQLVSKAMEGNFAALSRYGIKVDETLTLEGKRAQLMEKLEPLYQRAIEDADTYGGRVDQLREAYSDLLETLGGFVTKNQDVIDTLGGVKSIIEWLNVNVEKMSRAGKAGKFDLTMLFGPRAVWVAMSRVIRETGKSAQESLDTFKGLDGVKLPFKQGIAPAVEWAQTVNMKAIPALRLIKEGAKDAALALDGLDIDEASVSAAFDSWERGAESISFLSEALKVADTSAGNFKVTLNGVTLTFSDLAEVVSKGEMADEIARMERTLTVMGNNLPESEIKRLRDEIKRLKAEMNMTSTARKFADSLNGMISEVFPRINDVFSQIQENSTIALDNEYKKRLDFINATIADEELRQQAIMALEAEYAIRRTAEQRKAAKAAKAIAMFEAIINTADAYTKALAQGGFIFGIPMATIIAALGAAQIAAIAAQPIPLAKGGYFKEPTLLSSASGQGFEVAEAGYPEIVAPEPAMRRVVREEMNAAGVRAGASFAIHIKGPVIATSAMLTDDQINAAAAQMFKAIENQARLRGRRLM